MAAAVLALLFLFLAGASVGVTAPEDPVLARLDQETFTGDWDQIVKRRYVRVLVSYSKSNFFFHQGEPRGFEVELLKGLPDFLRQHKKLKGGLEVVYIPVAFEELLPALEAGRGDLAAAGLTITPEREKRVAFSRPYLEGVEEIVVAGPREPAPASLDDLCGREVHLLLTTSFAQHLAAKNRAYVAAGRPLIRPRYAEGSLSTEDLLEMVDAGILPYTVADRHVAELWSAALTNMVLCPQARLSEGGRIAWAVRKNAPKLKAVLDEYAATIKKGTLLGNILFKRYYQAEQWIKNPLTTEEQRRMAQYRALFERYAGMYGHDWLGLAAQAYQESGLDASRRSAAGAVGLMQVLPSTASAPPISIPNVSRPENNIEAGAKYMAHLRETYFTKEALPPAVQWDFMLAAYNMGPARLAQLRRQAAKAGLNPDRWFNHVEYMALRQVGREPVRYVGNINKYYVAYRLLFDLSAKHQEAVERIQREEGAK